MTRPRLREQPLTLAHKPRVLTACSGQFWVEKMTPHGPIVEVKESFTEAINLASWWGAIRKEAAK